MRGFSEGDASGFLSTLLVPSSLTNDSIQGAVFYVLTSAPAPPPPPCFVKGTRILTPKGYMPIERLQSNDKVVTADKRIVSIQLYSYTIRATTDTAPYRIAAGALGHTLPARDLRLSPRHAIKDNRGIWQIPKFLASRNPNVKQYGVGESVTYYHIECPNYYKDNLIAEGSEVESFRNKQGGKGVTYVWNYDITGWERVGPKDTIQTENRYVIFTR